MPVDEPDPIGTVIANPDAASTARATGSLPAARDGERRWTRPRQIRRAPAREPWRRRLVRTLLYGRNVDRAAKARARIGLAILVFALGYAVIAGAARDVRGRRPKATARGAAARQDAVATARPDILDRNGEILATDVRTPSLFAEPHRIIDVDEAIRAADRGDARPRRRRAARAARLQARLRLAQARDHAEAAAARSIGSAFPASASCRENKRVYPNGAEVSHLIGHVNIDNQGIAGIEKWLDARGLADLHLAGLATDRLQKPVELAVDLRVQHALRDELDRGARQVQGAWPRPASLIDVRTGEIVSMVSVPDYDPNNPREALDPTRINRLTTGVFEMGSTFKALTVAMALDSGKITLNSVVRRAHAAALRQVHHPRLPRPEPRAHGAGDLHLFVQHRHRAHGAQPRRRAPQGVPAGRWASSTGCAPNCRKAPSRSCPSAGASSTP